MAVVVVVVVAVGVGVGVSPVIGESPLDADTTTGTGFVGGKEGGGGTDLDLLSGLLWYDSLGSARDAHIDVCKPLGVPGMMVDA